MVEVSGAGFINLTLSDSFVADQLGDLSADARLGVEAAAQPQTVVIDYSAPNLAKEMHVGHLRSTLIGDSLARVLGFLGHTVLRENHIGDWGTPFGMLIEHLLDVDGADRAASFSVSDLNEFYAAARRQFDSDPDFVERSRRRVVLLQNGDEETLALWRIFVAESMRHAQEIYRLLGVLLTPEDTVGESFYNPFLPVVVDELTEKGLVVEDDGALCVFPPGFENRRGEPLPLIVRKSDGGYGYPATDLAAVRDRTGRLEATKLVYVVGAEQALHLRLVFAVSALRRLPARHRRSQSTSHVSAPSSSGPTGKAGQPRRWFGPAQSTCSTKGIDRAAAAMKDRASELSPDAPGRSRARAGRWAPSNTATSSTERTQRLRLRLGPDARLRGGHRSLPPVRRTPGSAPSSGNAGVPPPGPCTPVAFVEAPGARPGPPAPPPLRPPRCRNDGRDASSPSKLCSFLFDLATCVHDLLREPAVSSSETSGPSPLASALCDVTARVLECGLSLLGMEAPEQM